MPGPPISRSSATQVTVRLERATVSLAVHPTRKTAEDEDTRRRKLAAQHSRHLRAVGRARPRAHNSSRRPREQLRIGGTPHIQPPRRIMNRTQKRQQLVSTEELTRQDPAARDRRAPRQHAQQHLRGLPQPRNRARNRRCLHPASSRQPWALHGAPPDPLVHRRGRRAHLLWTGLTPFITWIANPTLALERSICERCGDFDVAISPTSSHSPRRRDSWPL